MLLIPQYCIYARTSCIPLRLSNTDSSLFKVTDAHLPENKVEKEQLSFDGKEGKQIRFNFFFISFFCRVIVG